MNRLALFTLALSLFAAPALTAQNQNTPPAAQSSAAHAKHPFGQPRAQATPGGGPDKVWVNTTSKVYHCPGDRYYGKTSHGQYMTEKDARASGAHGVRNQTCFSK